MNAGLTFVTHVETAKSVQPGQRALHDPARASQAAAVWRPALGELGIDAAPMQLVAMRLRIVSSVTLDEAGFAPGAPGTAAQRWNGVDQRQQLGNVVSVGAREQCGQRDPARIVRM